MPRKMNTPKAMYFPAFQAEKLRQRIDMQCVTDSKGCWIWNGYVDNKGYSQISVEGVMRWAHRVSYAAHKGKIPRGKHIHHCCYNPSCVNPDHLSIRDFAENSGDKREDTDIPF